MRILLSLILGLITFTAVSQNVEIPKPTKKQWFNTERKFENCEFKGQKMDRVKVRFTNPSNAKYKVKIVENNEDLTVRFITYSWTSNLCGQWILVDTDQPDFTVAVVEYGEDFTIRITED